MECVLIPVHCFSLYFSLACCSVYSSNVSECFKNGLPKFSASILPLI